MNDNEFGATREEAKKDLGDLDGYLEQARDLAKDMFGCDVVINDLRIREYPGNFFVVTQGLLKPNDYAGGRGLKEVVQTIGLIRNGIRGMYRSPDGVIEVFEGNIASEQDAKFVVSHEVGHALHELNSPNILKSPHPVREAFANMFAYFDLYGEEKAERLFSLTANLYREGHIFDNFFSQKIEEDNMRLDRDTALLYYLYKTLKNEAFWEIVNSLEVPKTTSLVEFMLKKLLERRYNEETAEITNTDEQSNMGDNYVRLEAAIKKHCGVDDINELSVNARKWYLSNEYGDPISEEEMAVDALLLGRPTKIYHTLSEPEDFDGVLENGFRGSYTIRKSAEDASPVLDEEGRPLTRAYFNLTTPNVDRARLIYLDINGEIGIPLKVFDGRNADVPITQLLELGFDGHVVKSGVAIGSDDKYMLTLYDGAALKGSARRFNDISTISASNDTIAL